MDNMTVAELWAQMDEDRASNPAGYWDTVAQAAATMAALHRGEITRGELREWIKSRLPMDDHPGAAQGR